MNSSSVHREASCRKDVFLSNGDKYYQGYQEEHVKSDENILD